MKGFKRSSWHHKVFEMYWHKTPTSNGCEYFKGWFLLIVLFPVTFLGFLWFKTMASPWPPSRKYYEELKEDSSILFKAFLVYPILSALVVMGSSMLGVGVAMLVIHWSSVWPVVLEGLAFLIALVIIVALAVAYDENKGFMKRKIRRAEEDPESASFFINMLAGLKQIKEGLCPTIEWEEDK